MIFQGIIVGNNPNNTRIVWVRHPQYLFAQSGKKIINTVCPKTEQGERKPKWLVGKENMDIYGHGQIVGALITCYCKKNKVNIDDFMNEIRKNTSMFVSGMEDGVGGNRENGKSTNNFILEDMKL